MERDLTRGGIPGHLLAMSLSVMLGYLAQTLYDLVALAAGLSDRKIHNLGSLKKCLIVLDSRSFEGFFCSTR
jgi:hypothetical protein